MKPLLSLVLLAVLTNAFSQTFTTSNLPIVVLQTNGVTIDDEPKVVIDMGIIDNPSGLNNLTDTYNGYNGKVGADYRGNSTQGFDKKTYSIELRTAADQDTSISLLGLPKEEDWILHAMVIDKTLLRIPMSLSLWNRMGHYGSRYRYVELVVDGDYRGIYILTEKIKRDKNRVDIAKLANDDLAGDSLTGGYILRIDWLDNPQGFTSNHNSQAGIPMFYQWYYPKADKIQPAQASYIQTHMGQFEEALFSSSFSNTQGLRYDSYMDVTSFVDFLLINEFSKNSDGYKLSSYFHKDKDSKGGKFVMGPIWDFDQTYGLSTVCSSDDYTGWTYLQNQNDCEDLESMPMWWQKFMSDTLFSNHLACRWEQMRQGPLHLDSINLWIDNNRNNMQTAIDRNFVKWQFLGSQIWIEPFPLPQTYQEEIDYVKNWITNRLTWLDSNIPGNCQNDVIVQASVSLPSTQLEIKAYPNPFSQNTNIVFGDVFKEGADLNLFDLSGKLVYKKTGIHSSSIEINAEQLKAGLYFAEVRAKDKIGRLKLVVK